MNQQPEPPDRTCDACGQCVATAVPVFGNELTCASKDERYDDDDEMELRRFMA